MRGAECGLPVRSVPLGSVLDWFAQSVRKPPAARASFRAVEAFGNGELTGDDGNYEGGSDLSPTQVYSGARSGCAQQGRRNPDRDSGCPSGQDEDEESSIEVTDFWIDRASDSDDLGGDSRTEDSGDTESEQPRVPRHRRSLAKLEYSAAEQQRWNQRNGNLIQRCVAAHRAPVIADPQIVDMHSEDYSERQRLI